MERSGEVRCVRIGVFRVLGTQEGQSATEGPVEGPSCINCGEGISREGVELNEETVDVILKALLLPEEEVSNCRLWACVGCYSSLHSFLNLIRQLQELRVTFNDQRRRLGLHVVLKSLRKPQESYDGWLAAVKWVEDGFPLDATGKLRTTKNVAVGTDDDEGVRLENAVDPSDVCDIRIDHVETLFGKDFQHMNSDVLTERSRTEPEDSHPGTSTKQQRWMRVYEEDIQNCKSLANCNHPSKRHGTAVEVINVEDSGDEEPPESSPVGQWTPNAGESAATSDGDNCDEDDDLTSNNDESEDSSDVEFVPVTTTGELLTMPGPSESTKSSSGNGESHRCAFCPKTFCNKFTVRRHCYKTHKSKYLEDSPYACRVCFHLFSSSDVLEVHMKLHDSNLCSNCGKAFSRKQDLKRHMTIHNEALFVCFICEMKFKDRHALKRHMASHSEERPFVCSSCGRSFKWINNLKRHMKVKRHN